MFSAIFGEPASWPWQDLIGISEEMDATMTLAGYTCGVFPMPIEGLIGWWSPLERGVLPLNQLRVTRSLRKSIQRYTTTVDAAFDDVVAACADPARPDGWIDEGIKQVYGELHRAGAAHSIEVWSLDRELVGGLYGVQVGGLFAGESMFHHPSRGRDASKVALVRLVALLKEIGATLLDVQWVTGHLASLGAIEVPRNEYLYLLNKALEQPTRWPDRCPLSAGK